MTVRIGAIAEYAALAPLLRYRDHCGDMCLGARRVRAGWLAQHGMTSSDLPPYAPQDCWGREPADRR